MEHVPYFEVFRLLVMEQIENLKKLFFHQCSKDAEICSVSVFQLKKVKIFNSFKNHFRSKLLKNFLCAIHRFSVCGFPTSIMTVKGITHKNRGKYTQRIFFLCIFNFKRNHQN